MLGRRCSPSTPVEAVYGRLYLSLSIMPFSKLGAFGLDNPANTSNILMLIEGMHQPARPSGVDLDSVDVSSLAPYLRI